MPRKVLIAASVDSMVFGGLPLSQDKSPSVIDASFGSQLWFTTTGATIERCFYPLRSSLFWRSFTHLIGVEGCLCACHMDNAKNSHWRWWRFEVPGPVFGKVVSKLEKHCPDPLSADSASLPFCGYLHQQACLYDSFVIAMGTAGASPP